MNARSLAFVAALSLVLLGSAMPARAEVSAEVDAFGTYVQMQVSGDASAGSSVWAVQKDRPNYRPLNPTGYLSGDLYPAVRESNEPGRAPWVVWSRPNGGQYDLVYSRWGAVEDEWQTVAMVEPWVTPGNDLGPVLGFDIDYRPYLAWTRSEGGVNRVYMSLWLQTRWMSEFRVSDVYENAVATSVRLLPDRRIEIRYDTQSARVTRIISFDRPRTITDDVTPFGRFHIDETFSVPIAPLFPR